jgi:hypothetical protein
MRNPFRKKKETFEALSNRSYKLRYEITEKKDELAVVLALLEQYSTIVAVDIRTCKDTVDVSPSLGSDWSI